MVDTVGAVYVKVYSDSSGFKKQLEGDAETAGKKAAVHFGDSFDKQVTKNLKQINLEKSLGPQMDKWGKDFAKRVSSAVSGETVKFKLDDVIDKAELKRMSRDLGVPFKDLAQFLKTEIPKAARKGFSTIEKEAADAARAAERELKRRLSITDLLDDAGFKNKIHQMASEFQKTMTPAMKKALTDGQKVDWRFDDDIRKALKNIAQDSKASFSDVATVWDRTIRRMAQSSEEAGFFTRMRAGAREVTGDIEIIDRSVIKLRSSLRRAGTGGFFDSLTSVFGGIIGLSFKLGSVIPKSVGLMAKAFTGLGKVFTSLAAKAGKFAGAMGKIGGVLGRVGAALSSTGVGAAVAVAGLLASMVALTRFMGAFVTLVVDAAGVMSMLAAGIAAAAIQAVVLVPVLVSLGAGLGALVMGAGGATKALGLWSKAMKETDPKKRAEALKAYNAAMKDLGPNAQAAVRGMQPLVKQFESLRKQMAEKLFDGFASALKQASPMVKVLKDGLLFVSEAIGDVIDQFLRLGQNDTFIKNWGDLWASAGTIIRDVGSAIVNVFAGLVAVFAAIIPQTEEFTNGIRNIGQAFRVWAESEGGRQAIQDWFTRVWEIGSQVWTIIKLVGEALGNLFTGMISGGAGDVEETFLAKIVRKLEELNEWIKTVSENGELEGWLQTASDTATTLWNSLVSISTSLKSLNTEENRAFAHNLVSVMNGLIAVFNAFAWFANQVAISVGAGFQGLGTILNGITQSVGAGWNGLKAIWAGVSASFTAGVHGMTSIFNGFLNQMKAGWASAMATIKSLWQGVVTSVSAGARGISAAVRGIGSAFDWLIGKIKSVISWISRIKMPSLSGLRAALNPFGAAGGVFTSPTTKIIGEAGPEALIPLSRPLSLVDPSVRDMAAQLRGKGGAPSSPRSASGGRQMTNYWNITSPSPDARVVASQVMNRMTAMAG